METVHTLKAKLADTLEAAHKRGVDAAAFQTLARLIARSVVNYAPLGEEHHLVEALRAARFADPDYSMKLRRTHLEHAALLYGDLRKWPAKHAYESATAALCPRSNDSWLNVLGAADSATLARSSVGGTSDAVARAEAMAYYLAFAQDHLARLN